MCHGIIELISIDQIGEISMEKKYQIFISSTYKDLIEERQKVRDTILSMYQFPIGMEMFSAADEEQWEIIQETIDSSDYYILIIAHRYGTVIESGEYSGISFTEKEYRYAKEKGIPILAFIIDGKVPIIPGNIENDPVIITKLNDFKSEVMDGRMVEWWTSKEDLAIKVALALQKQISRGKRPGWVRANISIEETQAELIAMSKKIRSLEEENTELKRNFLERKPILQVLINDKTEIQLHYQKINTSNIDYSYMPLDEEEANSNVSVADIRKYNESLPSSDELALYKKEYIKYNLFKEHNVPIDISVSNIGTAKANDVSVEIEFPNEILIERLDKTEDLEEPVSPKRERNPFNRYLESSVKFNGIVNSFSIKSPAIMPHFNLLDYSSKDYMDKNSIIINDLDLLHTMARFFKNKYCIIATQRGEFEIVCRLMCEEYLEEEIQIIKVYVD